LMGRAPWRSSCPMSGGGFVKGTMQHLDRPLTASPYARTPRPDNREPRNVTLCR